MTRATSNRDQIICPSQFSPYVLWEIKSLAAPWLTVLLALFAKFLLANWYVDSQRVSHTLKGIVDSDASHVFNQQHMRLV